MFGAALRFGLLASVKAVSLALWSFSCEWVGRRPRRPFRGIRLALLLNHTSLFEPIYLGVLPLSFLGDIARRGVIPGADITYRRPLLGRFLQALVPTPVAITRRRDASWDRFLAAIRPGAMVLMAPEGRMMRRGGFDKHGKPMTVRGGVADVLERLEGGNLLLIYCEGLHHIQAPGEGFPRLFERARARLEVLPIAQYKKALGHGTTGFRERVIADLEARRDRHCPWGAT